MLIIDTNLLCAVTKYEPSGRLRAGHASPSVTQSSSGWRILIAKIYRAIRQLKPPSIGPIAGIGARREPDAEVVVAWHARLKKTERFIKVCYRAS